MSMRMLKYTLFDTQRLVFDDVVRFWMPRSLGINHVAMQNGVVTLSALVDDESGNVTRMFHIAETGHVLPFVPCYLGTVFDRQFVWHIFESFPEVAR